MAKIADCEYEKEITFNSVEKLRDYINESGDNVIINIVIESEGRDDARPVVNE